MSFIDRKETLPVKIGPELVRRIDEGLRAVGLAENVASTMLANRGIYTERPQQPEKPLYLPEPALKEQTPPILHATPPAKTEEPEEEDQSQWDNRLDQIRNDLKRIYEQEPEANEEAA